MHIVVGLLMLGLASSVWGQGYQAVPVEIPGCVNTWPGGINEKKQMSFTCSDEAGVSHVGIWRTDHADLLVIDGASQVSLAKINQKRHAVGNYIEDATQELVGYKWQLTKTSEVAVPWAFATEAVGINNFNDMTGAYIESWVWEAFLRTGQSSFVFHPVQPPGAEWSRGADVNDNKVVFGSYGFVGGPDAMPDAHGFLYRHATGVYLPVDVPGACNTTIHGGNNKEHFVGAYQEVTPDGLCEGAWRGFVFDAKGYAPLDFWPIDINNKGQILGVYWTEEADGTWRQRVLLATPSAAAIAQR